MQKQMVFISYARVDKPLLVVPLVNVLRDGGYEPWFDNDLIPGQDWKTQLSAAIRSCDVFVYAMTPESLKSEWCLWELKQAAEMQKPIIPVRLQPNIQMPQELDGIQWVDFADGYSPNAVAKLMRGLRNTTTIPIEKLPNVGDNPYGLPSQARQAQVAPNIVQPKPMPPKTSPPELQTYQLKNIFGFTDRELELNKKRKISRKQAIKLFFGSSAVRICFAVSLLSTIASIAVIAVIVNRTMVISFSDLGGIINLGIALLLMSVATVTGFSFFQTFLDYMRAQKGRGIG